MISRHLNDNNLVRLTLDANGAATHTLLMPLAVKPMVVGFTFEEAADNQPIIIKVKGWTKTGANWAGVTINAYRAAALPTNTAQVHGFNVFSSGGLAGIRVCVLIAEAPAP